MHCYLPAPYEDELLYSVIARYLIYIKAKNFTSAISLIFNHAMKPCIDIPGSLEILSERTRIIWNMPAKEIAYRHTLFPYYARYLPKNRADRCLDGLLSNNNKGTPLRLGIIGNRVKVPKFLRFCNSCRKTDILKNGETYWHRSHQLPGVLVCPQHNEFLVDTKVLFRPIRLNDYIDATMGTADIKKDIDLNEDDVGKLILQKIAKRCQEMLLGPIAQWNTNDLAQAYRQSAIRKGFVESTAFLSQAKIEKAFASFYGDKLLSMLGCAFWIGKNSNWVRGIFRAHHRTFHPIEHALIQTFLESLPNDPSVKLPFGFGPWKCPNPYAKHAELYPIKKVKLSLNRCKELVASAKCNCGFCFTFLQTSDLDPELPIVHAVRGFGATWKAEAERLKEYGLSRAAIGHRMCIADQTVQHLLEGKIKRKTKNISCEQIAEWRKEWEKLLSEVPNRSRKLALERNGKLYRRLRRYDREWLYTEKRQIKATANVGSRVDWEIRDRERSLMLKIAALKIKNSIPIRQVTKTSILKEAGLATFTMYSKLDYLPLCKAVINEYSETLEECRERRIRTAAAKARAMGKPVKYWKLKKHCKIISSRLDMVIKELCNN